MEIIKENDSIYVNYDVEDYDDEIQNLIYEPGSFEEFEEIREKLGYIDADFIEFERHQGGTYGRSIYHLNK